MRRFRRRHILPLFLLLHRSHQHYVHRYHHYSWWSVIILVSMSSVNTFSHLSLNRQSNQYGEMFITILNCLGVCRVY